MDKLENEKGKTTTVNYKSRLVAGAYIDLLGTRFSASSQFT